MAHISLPEGLPGIRALLAFSPETAKPMGELAERLLRGPGTLTLAEREMVAAVVSYRNECHFCHSVHAAVAAEHLGGTEQDHEVVATVQRDIEAATISDKMKALLTIAALVAKAGKLVTTDVVERARRHGATDQEIHDVVLIAAAFCMFNRYVDGLGTWQPDDPEMYRRSGKLTAELGYLNRSYTPTSS